MYRSTFLPHCEASVASFLETPDCPNIISNNGDSDLHCEQIWTIIPNTTPKIIKRCSRCRSHRFSSSDRFRVNANKKVIDAWLIYKCESCDATLKVRIISRISVSKINQTLLDKLQVNDQILAWQYAFNVFQQQKDVELDWEIGFDVSVAVKNSEKLGIPQDNGMNILVKCEFFLKIPLFSLLRQKLSCSRNQLEKLQSTGGLEIYNLQGQVIKLKAWIGAGCLLKLSREGTAAFSFK